MKLFSDGDVKFQFGMFFLFIAKQACQSTKHPYLPYFKMHFPVLNNGFLDVLEKTDFKVLYVPVHTLIICVCVSHSMVFVFQNIAHKHRGTKCWLIKTYPTSC